MKKKPFAFSALGAAVLCVALGSPVLSVAAVPAAGGIAWQAASSESDVDKAFALARQSGKPVFLYWGAVWCPPCNQVKATLFSRPDFVERSRAFVPVYVDGDKPGAQKVASRYNVSGYPTMILFKPDGTEVTRLPGEVDPERYLLALNTGLNAQVPVKELVKRALGSQPLTAEQWRLLAFYSWDTDEQQVLPSADLAKRLGEMAAAVPAELRAVKDRLTFKSIVARSDDKSVTEAAREADRRTIERMLADPGDAKELAELFVIYAKPVVSYVAPGGEARKSLVAKWDAVLARIAGAMSRSNQLDALDSRVELWKLVDGDKLSAERKELVVREVARLVAATTDRYERQAVVPNAGAVLAHAGMFDDSDALLKAELPRAVAPYYHMLGLAGNAKKRGDAKTALQWYEQAWRKSEGPATRVQWGSTYVANLVDLTPADHARIAAAAQSVLAEAKNSESFYGRTQRSLERMAKKLNDWKGADKSRGAAVDRLQAQLKTTCAHIPAKDSARASCEKVFAASASPAA